MFMCVYYSTRVVFGLYPLQQSAPTPAYHILALQARKPFFVPSSVCSETNMSHPFLKVLIVLWKGVEEQMFDAPNLVPAKEMKPLTHK